LNILLTVSNRRRHLALAEASRDCLARHSRVELAVISATAYFQFTAGSKVLLIRRIEMNAAAGRGQSKCSKKVTAC
jgi:hypothetical protein